jgi:two-component system, sensor histidine kinase and response regulator
MYMNPVLKDKIILIVDDYEINRQLFGFFVEDAGGICLAASGGQQCIDILQSQHVDLVLMDRKMPEMDGLATTKAVRALPAGKDIIIVGITGCEEESEINECIDAGMNLALSKVTFTPDKLDALGEQFFGNGNGNDSLQTGDTQTMSTATSTADLHSGTENPAASSVMDYDKALVEFENDHELLNSLLIEFVTISHRQYLQMQQALSNSDIDCIQSESHAIKGGAANLCALPLSDSARKLELACKEHASEETLNGLLEKLSIAIGAFELFVKDKLRL